MSTITRVACCCEHARHFDRDAAEYGIPHDGHAYGQTRADAQPADVPYQHGDPMCRACLDDCHAGSRWL